MKAEEASEGKPSGAGMTDEEIKNLPLDELISLKSSISNYLKCRKLKNRNNEFITLYMRINNEISLRSAQGNGTKKAIFETKVDKSPLLTKKQLSSGNLGASDLKTFAAEENNHKKIGFLKRKFSFSQSLHDIVFPSFLNDVVNGGKKKVEKITEKIAEEISQNGSEFFEEEKPAKKVNVNKTKKCIKGKIFMT